MRSQQIEGFRLSPQQKHLWLLQQEQTIPYRVQAAILITAKRTSQPPLNGEDKGNLNLEMLKTAIQQVVNKHEILRTTFHCLPGMTIPLQVIADDYQILVDTQDLSELPLSAQETKITSIYENLKHLNFDLENCPPIYISLVTLSPDKCILLMSLSALIADSITLKLLSNEIKTSYEALNQESQFDAPMQYADIAEWQNELLETAESEVGKQYWQNQNINSIPNLQLWFEKQEVKKLEFQPESISLDVTEDLIKKIEKIEQKYDTSFSVILLACWMILLGKLAGQSDLVVNIASDGRKYEELELALGLLAKYIPLSWHLAPNLTFNQLLKQVHELVKHGNEWQEYYTWENSKEAGDRTLNSSSAPICFEFEEWQEIATPDEITFSIYRQYSCIDRFKLKLACHRQKDTLVTDFYFDSSLYNLENIQDLSKQFQTLLTSAVDRPEATINQLNILSDRDRQQILFDFNYTTVEYPRECIHQLIEAQAARTPHNIAVVFEGQQLTYAQLNTRANQLAHYLQQLGVGTEVVVALYIERSLELVIGMLAILKAGGAYLPLDPTLPKSGLALRLQDVQPLVLLTQQQLVEQLPECSARKICLDADWQTIATASQENPRNQVRAENLAYVLFTSGSTGKPKGVAVEHRHLVNYIYAVCDRLDLAECNSFATVSTFAADLGNTAIFPALCSSRCLHVISSERASNPEALADYFQRHPIDCLKIVPSHLAALLTAAQPERILPKLRLILGGEACSWQIISQIQQYAPNCRIFNHYGPTETTVGALAYSLQPGEKPETQTVPIGRPLANTQVYLLDSELQPVPIGVAGELYIGGAGVARGYVNRPELTREKFIPNPFEKSKGKSQKSKGENQESELAAGSQEWETDEESSLSPLASRLSPSHLYKTGDLARYLPDGNIEFIGRSDRQVKVHGFRIEPGEIEAALRQHAAVRETVVLGREDRGNQRLVAYVVPEQNCNPTTSELRDFLLDLFPESIVPSVFVRLKALPLTPNGKIDFQGLPAPDPSKLETGTFVAPRTTTEQVLAEIWAKILALPQVGIHDNFFELGGDSIQSIRIVAKANQAGLQLTPKQMFEHQTIAELAAVAGIAQIETSRSPATPDDPSPVTKGSAPADFPGANLNRKDLDQLLAQIHRKSNQKNR